MTDRSIDHDSFVITRTYPAAPAAVFAAWADPIQKARWFGEPGNAAPIDMDFRVGGHERINGMEHEGHVYTYEARYRDIVARERIVYTYEMTVDGQLISVSLSSVQFEAAGDGTAMTYTEQGAFLDGLDTSAIREAGTRTIFDALASALGEADG